MKSISLSFLFSLMTLCLLAQGPVVNSVFPTNQTISAATNVNMLISFDQPLDLSTVDYSTFKVFGRWSGPMAFAFSFSNNDQTVELIPEELFSAGEWVTVSINKGLKGANGENMNTAYTWNFWVETAPGVLDQTFVEQIPMREPGEGWIESYGAYAGDLNNDGYSDLTVINEESDDLRIMLNDGNGNYDDFSIIPMGSERPSPNEGGDFNGDGEIDLVVTTVLNGEVRVLLGDGTGAFPTMTTYPIGEAIRGVAVTDLDGDGNDDILVTNRDGNNLSLFVNDGTGAFSMSEIDIDPDGDGENSCAMTDANQDGIPDVFIGYFHTNEMALYLGDGDGNFTMSAKRDLTGKPWMAACGDFNGDGFADVAAANSGGNNMSVLFGDGAGNLSLPVVYSFTNSQFPLAIDLGDLDGDGDLDVVTSNYTSSNFFVFENDGLGEFSVAAILASPQNASCAILHDRDNDGDLDITGTDETDDVVLIFRNGLPVSTTQAAAAVELDVFPNPFSRGLQLSYQLEAGAVVQIDMLNLFGRQVAGLKNAYQPAGNYDWYWEAAEQPSGVYLLRVAIGAEVQSYRLVKVD